MVIHAVCRRRRADLSKALSLALRRRVLAAVAGGLRHRRVGERFEVSAASVSRWRAREREQGDATPKALGGDRRSQHIEAHAELILSFVRERPDSTLADLRLALT